MPARSAVPPETRPRLPGIIASFLALLLLASPAAGKEQAERTYLFALNAYRDGLYDVSAEGFREYLASPPPKAREPEANFFLGRALLELGRDEEALEALGAAARADNKGRVAPLARLLRARRYLDLARCREAEEETGRWLKYFPRHKLRWEVKLLRGRALVGLDRLDDAAPLFEEVAGSKGAPEELSVEALSRLAVLRAAQGEDEEAARAWAALVERAPGDPRAAQARLQLGARAAKAGRFREALERAEALLKSFPEAPEAGPARLLRAYSLFGLERWSEASDAYAEAARGDGAAALSDFHWERAGLAAYRAGRFRAAAEALARADDGPEGANLAIRSKAHRKIGEPDEALEASARLLAEYPRGRWAEEALRPAVELARATGRWEEARRGISAYLRGVPPAKRLEARYLLAHLELSAGRPLEAARLFEALEAEEGGLDRYRDVRYKRALALSAADRHRKALEVLELLEAEERAAVGGKAHLALEADIHRALEHYKASADRYKALLAKWPEEPEAGRWLLALAEMEEARGRPGEALGAYNRWLEGHGEDPAAPLVCLTVARLLVAVGRPEEAWASLEGLNVGDDRQIASRALLLKGRIALERRDYQAALAASTKAAEGLPADSSAHALARWRMARALEETERPSEAASHYGWLAEHAEDAQVREASEAGLKRMSARLKETKKTP